MTEPAIYLKHTDECTRSRPVVGRINHELDRRELACPECGRAVPIPWAGDERWTEEP